VDKKLYRTVLLLFAVAVVTWAFWMILRPFIVPICWALCFVAVTLRPYRALARKWKRPWLAAGTMTLATGIGILLPLGLVTLLLVGEANRLAEGGFGEMGERLKEGMPQAYASVNGFLERFGTSLDSLGRDIAQAASEGLPRMAASFAGGVISAVVGLLIMLGTQYFVYRDGERLKAFVKDVLPLPEQDTDRILATLHRTTVAALTGGLVVALCQGAIGGVGLAIVGVQAPLTWGLIMAAVSFIPLGGTALVWAPVAIWLFATGQTGSAIFLTLWGSLVLGLSDNVLRPLLLRRTGATEIHTLLLLFAIVSGVGIFGPSGIVFGPLLIAVLTTVSLIYREHVAPAVRATRDDSK
jgi:predicted PurR-regulated permease PerM